MKGVGVVARFCNGYVKVWRSMWDGDTADNPILFSLWNALLQMANWKESKIIWDGKGKTLPPGTVVFGIREFSNRWRTSPTTISKWLKYLVNTGRITLKTGTRGTVATICNWEIYQGEEILEEQPSGNQVDTEWTQSGNQVDLIEEGKKEEGKKEEENIVQRKRRTSSIKGYSNSFDLEAAYQKYPLKVGKTPGLIRLSPQIKTQEDYDTLLLAIEKYSKSETVRNGFIKNFKTFAGEWRDWAEADAGKQSRGSRDYSFLENSK